MAIRPAWYIEDGKVKKDDFAFQWHPGLAPSQKRKNVRSLHESINDKALEVSTKSDLEYGQLFSPFNLTLEGYPMESVFHGSKKYEEAGPFPDLYEIKPLAAKRDERHEKSGEQIGFEYKGDFYPITDPKSYFFNWLYYLAILDSIDEDLLKDLENYNYFTDIEFNPKKGVSNQARAITLIKALLRENDGKLPKLTKEEFYDFQNRVLDDGVVDNK